MQKYKKYYLIIARSKGIHLKPNIAFWGIAMF